MHPAPLPGPAAEEDCVPPRRLAELPLSGPGAAFTEPQGRGLDSFAPGQLADLVASIAVSGLLQPVLAEEIPRPDGTIAYRLVAGERRLRAMLWGAAHLPANPHFRSLPALVCPGPLNEAARRRWQLSENLARQDLRPGELGAALLWQRCALLAGRLEQAGCRLPSGLPADDPAARWQALATLAARWPGVAAPWRDVLAGAGIGITERRARAVTAAFRALPPAVSEDMDLHQVTVAARLEAARLSGREQATAEIWQAVKTSGRPDLLAAAAAARAADPALDAAAAASRAAAMDQAARQARTAARTSRQLVDPAVTGALIAGLRAYTALLRSGGWPGDYQSGSLRLLALEVAALLDNAPEPAIAS
jgi:ParB family chromosome partitioning protein